MCQLYKVAVDEVHDGLDDGVPLAVAQRRHHPKVEVHQLALVAHQQVAQVGIGMEEARVEHLAQRAVDERVEDVGWV